MIPHFGQQQAWLDFLISASLGKGVFMSTDVAAGVVLRWFALCETHTLQGDVLISSPTFFCDLGINARTSHILGKCSAPKLHPCTILL